MWNSPRGEERAQDPDQDRRALEEDGEVVDDVEALVDRLVHVPHDEAGRPGEEQPGDGDRRQQPLVRPREEEVDRDDDEDERREDELRQERDEVVQHASPLTTAARSRSSRRR
jgi:hypothetical protein